MSTDPQNRDRRGTVSDFLASAHVLASAADNLVALRLYEEFGMELTLTQYRMLQTVAHAHATRIRDISTLLGVSAAAASKAVERLVHRGLLAREDSEVDRRACRIHLSGVGRAMLRRYEAVLNDTLAALFPGQSSDELARATDFIDRMAIDVLREAGRTTETCLRCGVFYRKECMLRSMPARICTRPGEMETTGRRDPGDDTRPGDERSTGEMG